MTSRVGGPILPSGMAIPVKPQENYTLMFKDGIWQGQSNAATVANAFGLVVTNAASPTELNSYGTTAGELRVVAQEGAASDSATLYRLDASSDAQSLPYIVTSATGGLMWVAVAGKYTNAAPASAALTASRLLRTDASKNLESNAALTNTYVLYADSNGWPTGSASLTFSAPLFALSGRQTISQGSITDPATTLAITSTWNDAADTFKAFTVDVTDTNSASGSKLADLMVGSSSKFTVDKTGLMSCVGGITVTGTVQSSIGPGMKITGSPSAFTGDGPEFIYTGSRGSMASYARNSSAYKGFDFNALDFAFLISGVSQFTISSSNVSSFTSTTDATAAATAAVIMSGGLSLAKNLLARQGSGKGLTSTATAAGTTTLTSSSTQIQIFTGTTTQTLQLPAANLFGSGIAVEYIVVNRSTGTVTAQRAGSDTFDGGGTTDAILTNTTRHYVSNGSNQWHTIA